MLHVAINMSINMYIFPFGSLLKVFLDTLSLKTISISSSKTLASKVISRASYYLHMRKTFLSLFVLTFFLLLFCLQSLFHHFWLFFVCSSLLIYSLSSLLYDICLCYIFCHLFVLACHLPVLIFYLLVDFSALLQMTALIHFMSLVSFYIP